MVDVWVYCVSVLLYLMLVCLSVSISSQLVISWGGVVGAF